MNRPPPRPVSPATAAVFVLSRVTLGADVAVTSVLLAAAKRRFPQARIVLRRAGEITSYSAGISAYRPRPRRLPRGGSARTRGAAQQLNRARRVPIAW